MTRILFLAPTGELAAKAQAIITRRNYDVTVRIGLVVLKDGLDIARKAVAAGYKIIITRGGSVTLLRRHLQVPIIAVNRTSSSYIAAFEKIRQIKGPVAFFSVDEVQDELKMLCYFMNIDARYYQFTTDDDAKEAVDQAMHDHCQFGVGGGMTVIYAEKAGMPYYTLENTQEEIEVALDSAKQMLESILLEEARSRELQMQLHRYEAIFNYTHDGIIAIDKTGKVEVVNQHAEEILPLINPPYEGKHITEILPQTKLLNTLASGQKETDELMRFDTTIVNTNRIPVMINGQVEGVVATFRDIDSIRTSEFKIRSNLHRKGLTSQYRFSDMLGESKAFTRAIRIAKSYAKSSSNILIAGEMGTGKEMFAHAIHWESKRRKMPLVTVNCANSSALELKAELCGYEDGYSPFHVKGSQEGAFELAHGGTLFLDKLEQASLETQEELIQIIENKHVRRLGGDHIIPIDVRIIASTKEDLRQAVEEKRFLEELYYLLSILVLEIPPLRDREKDYLLFCNDKFHRAFGADYRNYETRIHQIEDYLNDYIWHGNIRQLYNTIERISVLLKNNMTVDEIISTLPRPARQKEERTDITLEKWTRATIIEALSASKLNISRAARLLNCSRTTLYKKMDEFNIKITNLK